MGTNTPIKALITVNSIYWRPVEHLNKISLKPAITHLHRQ
jgi:hypothetical protein